MTSARDVARICVIATFIAALLSLHNWTCFISTGHILPCGRHRGKSLHRELHQHILPRAAHMISSYAAVR